MSVCIVLMYHIVDRPKSEREIRLCCRPESFAAQMDYLRTHDYSVIGLNRLVSSVRNGAPLPAKAAVVTFDDGSSCIYEQALPILKQRGFVATVFMISGLVGRNNEWLSSAGFPQRRMLSAAELRVLTDEGIDVGSHTVTHPWLSRMQLSAAQGEIRDSKAQLEDLLGRRVDHFAYPFGDYSEAVRDAVGEAGYSGACSTRYGKRHTSADVFALRRVEVRGEDSLLQFALKLRVATHNMPPVPEARHIVRRGLERLGVLEKRRQDRVS